MEKWNRKCKFFDEQYACDTLSTENYKSCRECKFAQEYTQKILIIKLGAIGDVLRTTPVLQGLRKKYGSDILIYWMTNPESVDLLKHNHLIDKVLPYNFKNTLRIQQERFDILFSLEIDTPATLLANLVNANQKFGYYFDNGATSCFNQGAEAYLETAFINNVKINNRKTYQELIAEACEIPYNKEKIIFNLTKENWDFANNFKINNNLSEADRIIGINIGSANRWPSKFWDNNKIKKLISKLHPSYKIIILAGPNEIDKQAELINDMQQEGIYLLKNNPKNTLNEFAAIVNICDRIICGDTMVLHLASALNKKTIALFFVTSPWEIEDYSLTTKIISPFLEKYFYINNYIQELADSISIEEVLKALENN